MYERFTDRARRAMCLARNKAFVAGDSTVSLRHLYLGVYEVGGIGRQVIDSFDAAPAPPPPPPAEGNLLRPPPTHSPALNRALEYAVDFSAHPGDTHVGTEHLLFGLLRAADWVDGLPAMPKVMTLEAVVDRIRELRTPAAAREQYAPEAWEFVRAVKRKTRWWHVRARLGQVVFRIGLRLLRIRPGQFVGFSNPGWSSEEAAVWAAGVLHAHPMPTHGTASIPDGAEVAFVSQMALLAARQKGVSLVD